MFRHHRHRHWYRRRLPNWVALTVFAFMLYVMLAAAFTHH